MESRGKRPLKIWDCHRTIRKGLVVGSFEELLARGKDKLGFLASTIVRVVLECDGTQIEDGEYFRTLPNNTVLLLLRQGERWCPSGVEVVKAAISAIPRIVCETIYALQLHDETPSWKIMDNKGRVTVVLHWDHRHGGQSSTGSGLSDKYSPSKKCLSAQSSLDKLQQRYANPHITIINSEEQESVLFHPARRLSSQSNSFESAINASVHVHTPECAHHAHTPSRAGSPSTVECDFHCCALHEEGRKIAVHKSVATSPIQDGTSSPHHHSNFIDPSTMQRRPSGGKGHVRFVDLVSEPISSESETENTTMDDDSITSEKFLLLIDQLSVDQKKHLNIKDIGIILERLNSKILDVERLDRESDTDDCYNWTIKATIRGDIMRELGVIYNGNYYAISEHPGYKEENESIADDIDDEDDDRL